MSNTSSSAKITVACPRGHRLKGDARLVGKTVRCPSCEVEFVFAPTDKPALRSQPADRSAPSAVSDTGVMRILGEMAPPPPINQEEDVVTRPCARCGTPVPESLTVCTHCHCYLGALPSYLQALRKDSSDN